MAWRVASATRTAGASSTTFWCRRCTEHSRSKRCSTVPWVSPDHLHLDVPGVGQVPLHEDLVGAEGGRGLALRRRHRLGQLARRLDQAHAPAAPAGRRLDQQRVADARPRPPRSASVAAVATTALGSTGTPAAATTSLARALWPMTRMASAGGPTHTMPGRRTGLGQGGVLRQEPVARMEGVGARPGAPPAPARRGSGRSRPAWRPTAGRRRRLRRRGGCRRRRRRRRPRPRTRRRGRRG